MDLNFRFWVLSFGFWNLSFRFFLIKNLQVCLNVGGNCQRATRIARKTNAGQNNSRTNVALKRKNWKFSIKKRQNYLFYTEWTYRLSPSKQNLVFQQQTQLFEKGHCWRCVRDLWKREKNGFTNSKKRRKQSMKCPIKYDGRLW